MFLCAPSAVHGANSRVHDHVPTCKADPGGIPVPLTSDKTKTGPIPAGIIDTALNFHEPIIQLTS